MDRLHHQVFQREPFFHGNKVDHHHEVECQVDFCDLFLFTDPLVVLNAPGKLAFWIILIHRIFASLISIAFSSPVWTFCLLAFWRNRNSHAVIRRSQRREEYFFSPFPKGVAKDVDLSSFQPCIQWCFLQSS